MLKPARFVLTSAFLFASLAHSVPTPAAVADTTTAHSVMAPARGSIALASFRLGARLATRIRFPAGLGLGLAVCTAGIVLEIDHYVRAR